MINNKSGPPKGWGLIEELVENEAFNKEIERIRRVNTLAQPARIVRLMSAFTIPSSYYELLCDYLDHDKLKRHLVGSSVRVVSDHDQTVEPSVDPLRDWGIYQQSNDHGVYLSLSHDVTQPELIHFIKQNWKDIIKPRLNSIGPSRKRIGYALNPTKYKKVYEDYCNRKKLGLTVQGVAFRHGITVSQIYRIKNRQEKLLS